MITWALVSAATAFVRGANSYFVACFAFRMAEVGFWPIPMRFLTAMGAAWSLKLVIKVE